MWRDLGRRSTLPAVGRGSRSSRENAAGEEATGDCSSLFNNPVRVRGFFLIPFPLVYFIFTGRITMRVLHRLLESFVVTCLPYTLLMFMPISDSLNVDAP